MSGCTPTINRHRDNHSVSIQAVVLILGMDLMKPSQMRALLTTRKKKKSHKGLAVTGGILTFIVFYFLILAPIRQSFGSSCSGSGIFACPYMLGFAAVIAFMITLALWYIL